MKVFWSWQSDSPGKNNHYFVRDALDLALKKVADDLDLTEAERPEVDHDTKGEPGLVSIVDTIFEKINQAAVFVGDLTYVGKTEKGKLLPNPNVMIELGHAITVLGPERIILVSNRAYGGRPEDLPFDLRHRRAPISYDLPDTALDEDWKKAQRELVGALASALAGCLGRVFEQAAKTVEYPAAPARPDDRSTSIGFTQHFDPKATREQVFAFDWSEVSTDFDGFVQHTESAIKPRKKAKEQKALELMAEHYKNNRSTLPASVRDHRELIVELLMDGFSPEDAFAQAQSNGI